MKTAAITSIAWAVALRANLAAAHGYVSSAIIDGKNITGYLPYSGRSIWVPIRCDYEE